MKRALILAAFFLMAPQRADAEGKSDRMKTEPCSDIPPIALVQEPDTVFVPVPFAVNILKTMKAIKPREKPKCRMPGRVWHEGKCYTPQNLKLVKK